MEDREEYYEKLKKKVKVYKIIILIEIIIAIIFIIAVINENNKFLPDVTGDVMNTQEKDMYNEPFLKYVDKKVEASDAIKIIKNVISSNASNVGMTGRFIQVTTDIKIDGETNDGIYGLAFFLDNDEAYVNNNANMLNKLINKIMVDNKIEENGFKTTDNKTSEGKYKITADYNAGIIVSIHIDDLSNSEEPPEMVE